MEDSRSTFFVGVQFEDQEVEEILARMKEALNTIHECWAELDRMGLVLRKEKTASGN